MRLDAESLDRLGEGWGVVIDDALPAELADAWLARLAARDRDGDLGPAGVGRDRTLDPSVRADRTAFVEPDDPDFADAIRWFRDAGDQLSEGLRLALPAFSLQIAAFPPGARYVRHLDTMRGDPVRRLTATLYLDRSWRAEDEGALRLVEPSGERDVLPLGGRMVLFRSDAVEHEVRPTRRVRYAITAWFGSDGAIRR